MSLPPVGGSAPGPGLPGLPDDDDGQPVSPEWLEDPWLEAEWLESERDLNREEPPEADLNGPWPDPEADAPGDFGADVGPGFAADGLLNSLAPGPALGGFTADVFEHGLGKLSDDELVGVLLAARRLSSWQAALELTAVNELDARRRRQAARPESSRAGEHISDELAAALVLTGRSADSLLGLSRELDRLYMVLASLREGRIDRARAEVFAEELMLLTRIQACAIAAALIRPAEKMTTSQLRSAIRSLILATIPGAKDARDRLRADRGRGEARVEVWPESSGNAAIAGRELPAGEVIVADQRLTEIARTLRDAGAAGSLDELRAAIFVALLTGRDLDTLLPSSVPGELVPLSGTVNLTMPLSSWLGSAEAPGEAAGYGSLAAADCRGLADRLAGGKNVKWCLTLTDPEGRAVMHGCARASPRPRSIRIWLASVKLTRLECGTCTHQRGSRAYRPPEMMRHLVCIRQRTCAFPGCRRPAERCDLDHTIPFDQGGRTCECNLSPLCRRHHRAKQAPGWQLLQPQPGTLVWTAPHARTYTTQPGIYPV
ncbi:MAG TPA: hypothetical protein VGM14_12400 [Streptosporangiaceae bacterium]